MLTCERIELEPEAWRRVLEDFPEAGLCLKPEWLAFLQDTQEGEIVIAVFREDGVVRGYFAGMLIRRCGVSILGSPFPGWTSSYMGLVLVSELSRTVAIETLRRFAFEELGCLHFELMDRGLDADAIPRNFQVSSYNGFEVDLSMDEQHLLRNMSRTCRRHIRRASSAGVVIEQAYDSTFLDEYYQQLVDVFAKRRLVPTYRKDRVASLIQHLGSSGNLLLLRARDSEGHCIATSISLASNGRAEVWGAASWRAYQHLRPNELMFWEMLRYWKRQSVRTLDLGGAGEYKRQYGGYQIHVPWIRISRYPIIPLLRDSAALLVKVKQRWLGELDSLYVPKHTGRWQAVFEEIGRHVGVNAREQDD